MENSKITYSKALDIAIASVTDDEVKEKLTALKEKVEKKGSGVSKKVQQERDTFDEKVLSVMTSAETTVSDLLIRLGNPQGVTSSKVTSSLGRLMKAGKVTNRKDKGKSLYTLA